MARPVSAPNAAEPTSPHEAISAAPALDLEIPIPAGWTGEFGARATGETIAARLVGPAGAPVIAALGGISGTRLICDGPEPGARGWWPETAGPGKALDTTLYRLLGVEFTPRAPNAAIPITPGDQADLLVRALDGVGVERLHAFVGASYGGMVGLAFARRFPDRLERLVVISAAHRPHPMGTAWRGVQRRIMEFAQEVGRPAEGVSLARQLAMTTYRSYEEFADRFTPGLAGDADRSAVCDYVIARGEARAKETSAARYLSLSAAIDRHSEDPAAIRTPTLLISVLSDLLTPPAEMAALAAGLAGPATLLEIESLYGHDAFLKEPVAIEAPLRWFLSARQG